MYGVRPALKRREGCLRSQQHTVRLVVYALPLLRSRPHGLRRGFDMLITVVHGACVLLRLC